MDTKVQKHFNNLESQDKTEQYEAFQALLKEMEKEVPWAYEVWEDLVAGLSDSDNHKRSRYAQFLSRLAANSDPDNKILKDFFPLWKVTKDKKFVTARHSLQSIWRIGLAGEKQKNLVVNHFVDRFKNGTDEKNYTLIRSDILVGMRDLYDVTNDETIKKLAQELIDVVEDSKYQKKYKKIWKE